MATQKVFGHVPGVAVGTEFRSRVEAAEAGVHRARQAGITGNGADGAESVVVSGGYEDDRDYGDEIIYTGHGGKDANTGRQNKDQSLDSPGNAALVTSALTGTPVRVVRGSHHSPYAPPSGYRYDGLFRVESWWMEEGLSGFRVCRYRLIELTDNPPARTGFEILPPAPAGTDTPGRRSSTVQRVVRSGTVSEYVKKLHNHTCQICGLRLAVPGGAYAEAAHIRPVGRPHDGPDVPDNVLCLCPNCHVLFDFGAVSVSDDLVVTHPDGDKPLISHPKHPTNLEHFRYHREHDRS
ncbi:YDG/SRA domain-containing protein [Kribbella sp. NPDC056861]|uniref:YDG/SRA domain-containing protein n=1 Tax=Kribbella sp. NPDC056861 TaxID=3154857 RepID=UPI00341CCE21